MCVLVEILSDFRQLIQSQTSSNKKKLFFSHHIHIVDINNMLSIKIAFVKNCYFSNNIFIYNINVCYKPYFIKKFIFICFLIFNDKNRIFAVLIRILPKTISSVYVCVCVSLFIFK